MRHPFAGSLLLSFLLGAPLGALAQASPGDGATAFSPHWTGQLQLARSSQPSYQGGGQTETDLGFTATYGFNEAGNFLSAGVLAGSQKVEGAQAGFASVSVGGGLGLGIFSPSLTLQGRLGQSDLKDYSGTLNLEFMVDDSLSLGAILGGGFQGHQGPVSVLAASGTVNTKSWTAGIDATWMAFEDLSFNATLEQQTDITYEYQYEAASKTNTVSVNQADRIPSLSLGADWDFVKNFALEGNVQLGREYYPAGSFYSPVLGESVTYAKAATQDFYGYGISLTWTFDFAGPKLD